MADTNTPDIPTLNAELQTLLDAPPEADILERQTQILDQIFTLLVDDRLAGSLHDSHSYFSTIEKWLGLALKVQKQCTDTAKAKVAMDYMNDLGAIRSAPPPSKLKNKLIKTKMPKKKKALPAKIQGKSFLENTGKQTMGKVHRSENAQRQSSMRPKRTKIRSA